MCGASFRESRLSRRNQTPASRDYPTVAPEHDRVNLSHSWHVSPRVAFQMPLGPSKTAVPPLTSRIVHPSMVVGLVSGTGVGLVETFVRSTAVGPGGLVFCFFGNETEFVVWALLFEVSCGRPIAVAVGVGLVGGPGTRSDLA